jgi:tRNA(Arg) A34 adenosine deaminase TadA
MYINNEEVVCDKNFEISQEMLSTSSTILNNCYPKSWEATHDYINNFYFPEDYSKCTLYTTLSPCAMCSGAIILYNIPRVVIGENTTLMGAENFLKCNGVEISVLNDIKCRDLFLNFVCNNPEIWDEELAKVGNSTEVK